MRYARTPSTALVTALRGPLRSLLEGRTVAGLPLDPQLRENDVVMLYCGLTRVLVAKLGPQGVELTAHETYRKQPCAQGVLRRWALDERGLEAAVDGYLSSVRVSAAFTGREGAVQAQWMQVTHPWMSIDREAVIGGGTTASTAVDAATVAVRALDSRWAHVPAPKVGNKLDQLAVDRSGRLVLVELKYGGASALYQVPLQALRYAWEWAGAVGALTPALQELIEAKQALGLLPRDLPRLTGELRVAVAWGDRGPSVEVRRRLKLVLGTVSGFLPDAVSEIEVWELNGSPARVSELC